MERLTVKCDDGHWGLSLTIYDKAIPSRILEKLPIAIDRLAAYEDTGLTPEEIMGLCRMDRRAKMAELLRMEENKPLTPDDLPKMDGTPVYMVDLTGGTLWNQWIIFENSTDDGFIPMGGGWFGAENYGKTWLTYRRKPEEVQHEN